MTIGHQVDQLGGKGKGRMEHGRETQRPLGAVLVQLGVVTDEDVEGALAVQEETSEPLGAILVRRSLIARPMLAKALAAQGGRSLDEEGGFGSGLMAKLERLHLERRGLPSERRCPPADDPLEETGALPTRSEPEDPRLASLREREEALDGRERELEQWAAKLGRLEKKLKRQADPQDGSGARGSTDAGA